MPIGTKLEGHLVAYVESLLDRLVIDDEKLYLVSRRRTVYGSLHYGFGLGYAGLGYFLGLAERRLRATGHSLAEKVAETRGRAERTLLANLAGELRSALASPCSHGFCAGPAGVLLLNRFAPGPASETFAEAALPIILDAYSEADLSTLNPSFYGGLSGLLFFLSKTPAALSSSLVFRIADRLCEIIERDDRDSLFRGIHPSPTEVGFAWGISGLAFALRAVGDRPAIARIRDAIETVRKREDVFFEPGVAEFTQSDRILEEIWSTEPRPDAEARVAATVRLRNSLCAGSTGLFAARKERHESKALGSGAADPGPHPLGFCCGISGMLEITEKASHTSDAVFARYFEMAPNLEKALDDDFFLQGMPGIFYSVLRFDRESSRVLD